MRSIRRARNWRFYRSFFFAFVAIFCVSAVYFGIIRPFTTRATAVYMSATIEADNGTVDFSPGADNPEAAMSWVKYGAFGMTPKVYDAKVSLHDLPALGVNEKSLTINLPIGMSWVDDASGDANLLSQLDSSCGTNGIEKTTIEHEPVLGYAFSTSGSRKYCLASGAEALSISFKVKVDSVIDLGYINDAIVATLKLDDFEETARLSVNDPAGASTPGIYFSGSFSKYIVPGSTYAGAEGYNKYIRANHAASTYDVARLVTEVRLRLSVNNPAATIRLTTTDARYSLDDSDAANGNYVLTYRPGVASNASYYVPYSITFPDDLNPGDTVIMTNTGETDQWQVDGTIKTVSFRNTQTQKFMVPPSGELVTIGYNSLNPSDPTTSFDMVAGSVTYPSDSGTEINGGIGYAYINNRGGSDSAEKRIRFKFDTTILGVMMVRMPCGPGATISTVHVKTKSGIEKDVTVNRTCNSFGSAGELSYYNLGIEKDDFIAELEYDMGVLPASTQIHNQANDDGNMATFFLGVRRSNDDAVSTIEVFDVDDAENTTGETKITTRFAPASSADLSTPATQVVAAGNALNFAVNIGPWASAPQYRTSIYTPMIYIRQEARDAEGNFLPITNIKVTNGPYRGNVDITDRFGDIEYFDTATARVYVLDGRNVTDGAANISSNYIYGNGSLAYTSLTVSYTVETDLTTPDQTHVMRDMVFVRDPNTTGITTHHYSGDTYGIAGGAGAMVHGVGAQYYQIRGSQSLLISNSAKHAKSNTWVSWNEGANSIAIGTSDMSFLDMNMSIANNSGVDIAGPTITYLPIPKKDENWGSLNYNGEDFDFSVALNGALNNPDSSIFKIYYGKNISPTNDGAVLDNVSTFTDQVSTWTSSDWDAVNCIKIVATNIPASATGVVDKYDFGYRLHVVDSELVDEGVVDAWRPLYFQQLTNSGGDIFSGWYYGSYIAIQLADSNVSGRIFVDVNENGKFDAGEVALKESGWQIELYDKSSGNIVQTTETNENGEYVFEELIQAENGYYINVINKHPISSADIDGGMIFTKKGDPSAPGAYNSDNQASGSKTSTPMHNSAIINNITAARGSRSATYNIGVVGYVAKEQYSIEVAFDDRSNVDSIRPSTVVVNATDLNGNVVENSVLATNGWECISMLRRYSDEGEILSYDFSAEELSNYNAVVNRSGNNISVQYTQKKATLVVNHLKKSDSSEIASSSTQDVYYGASYSTSRATDDNYELDSIDGDAEGVVGGDIEVTYYYKLKQGDVVVHYLTVDGQTVADDMRRSYDYTDSYETSPLLEIPSNFINYELVNDEPDNYRGTISSGLIEVTYLYQKKDPDFGTKLKVTAPESVDSKNAPISYEIDYSANISDYIGDMVLTLVGKLPYGVSDDDSDFDNGDYDAEENTITWEVSVPSVNSYISENGVSRINVKKNISLVYEGASARDVLEVVVSAESSLEMKDNLAEDSVETEVLTPAKIITRFVDMDGDEIKEERDVDGIVGDEYRAEPEVVPGYKLVSIVEKEYIFGEEVQVVTYRYAKIANPSTFDDIIAWVSILLVSVIGGCVAWRIKQRTK